MGIATWPDLATQNAIEKNDKNKDLFCASRPYGVVSRAGRAYISPGRPFYPNTSHLVVFLVHLVVYLGLGSPLVLCTRNFIATPNLKKRINDTLSLRPDLRNKYRRNSARRNSLE